MDYNIIPSAGEEISEKKIEEYSNGFFELNKYERKAVIQNIIGKDFELVVSLRILPTGQTRKNFGAEARADDID